MRAAIRTVNRAFISSVLAAVYVTAVGFSFLIWKLTALTRREPDTGSHWRDASDWPRDAGYFRSPY